MRVCAEGMLNQLCSLLANVRFGQAFGFLDDVRWCNVRVLVMFMITPFFSRCSGVARLVALS
jgi:hypothetical protein